MEGRPANEKYDLEERTKNFAKNVRMLIKNSPEQSLQLRMLNN